MTRIEAFRKKMTGQMGKVHEIRTQKDLAGKVAEIARGLGIRTKPVAGKAAELKSLDANFRGARIGDKIGVSRADYGIAETGTLVFCSSPIAPPSINFVPEVSIAVLKAGDILQTSEEVWEKLGANIPRTLNMITGPSKTGDIEQTLFLGAHGPKDLHVIIIRT